MNHPLWQPFGTTAATSSFVDATISSLTVSSINGLEADQLDAAAWSFFPAQATVDMNNLSIDNVSQINANNTLFVGVDSQPVIIANNSSLTVPVEFFTGNAYTSLLSAITVRAGSVVANGITNNILFGNVGRFSTLTASTITANTIVALSTISATSTISTTQLDVNDITGLSSINGLAFSTLLGSGDWSLFPAISTVNLAGYDISGVSTIFTDAIYIDLTNTSSLFVSSINGAEFTGSGGGGINVSLINASTISSLNANLKQISSDSISTLGASIVQAFMSSIVFSPSITINVETGFTSIGAGLGTIGVGLLALATSLPIAGYEFGKGLGTGLKGATDPRPVNYITNNFETINGSSQLQISTLGMHVSSIFRTISTIPSTINDLNGSTIATSVNIETFTSTITSANPTCIRAVGDPLELVSSPFTYFQALNDFSWVELPSGGGGGTSSINASTANLSTLFLLPSTVLQSEASIGGILRVLEPDLFNLGQLEIQGVNIKNDVVSGTDGVYTGLTGTPYWLDQNFSSFQIALNNKPVTFSSISAPGLSATGNVIGQNLIALQQPAAGGSAQAYLRTSLDVPGDASFFGLTSNAVSWGKFVVNPNSNGIDIYNAIGGFPVGTKINVGSNGGLNFYDSGSNLMIYSSATLYVSSLDSVSSINGAAFPPSFSVPTNLTVSTLATSTLTVQDGTNYASPNSIVNVGCSIDGTAEITFQNKSTGSNASVFFFAVENTGGEYAGFGVNSLNLSSLNNTLFEIPGASIQSGTLDVVIGAQSDHSSNSGIYLTYQDGANAWHINSNGALSFNASYSNNVLSEGNFGTSNSIFTTNGAGAAPSWNNSASLININVSSLNVSSNLRWDETSFVAPQVFLSGGFSNSPVINTNIIASPYTDTLTFYKGFTNQDFAGGYICLAADNGLMGVNKIPEANVDLDVNGLICASNISTPQISTTQLGATSATISSITQPILLDNVPQPGTTLAAGFNFDPFVGSRFGVFDGKQMVQGGYFLTTDASLGGGNGQATFVYPIPLSSIMTFTGTYFTNSTSPGINTPVWVGNGTPDANGRASTIQVYGDANRDIFCYFLGFV